MSAYSDWMGYHVYLWHGISVFESGPVTADLYFVAQLHSYKILMNDVNPVH